MALKLAKNEKTGATYALINGEWQDVTHGHPALDANPAEAFLIGAGRQFDRFGAGIGNLVDLAQGDFDGIEARRAEQAEGDRLFNPLQQESPIAATAGQIAPFLATAPVSGTGAQFLTGAALTGLDYTGDPGQQLARAPVGGAVDIAANALFGRAGRMASRVANAISGRTAREAAETTVRKGPAAIENVAVGEARQVQPEYNRLIESGERLGMQFTPGQKANNPQQLQFEASLSSTPGMGSRFQSQSDNNRRVGEILIGRHLGLGDVTQFTQQELGQAYDVIQGAFERVAAEMQPVKLPESFFDVLEAGKRNQLSELNQLDSRFRSNVEPFFDNFLEQARRAASQGAVQPRQLMQWRSDLADLMKQAGEPGNQLSGSQPAISLMIDNLDKVIKQGAGKELAGVYNEARGRWRVLKTIENARAVDAGGQGIRPRQIARALGKEFPEEFARGRLTTDTAPDNTLAQIMDWARAMTATRDIVGNSGTATRMFVQNALSDPQGAVLNAALGNTVGRGYEAIAPYLPESFLRFGVPQVPSNGGIVSPPNAGFSPLGIPNLGGAAAVGAGNQLIQ